MVKKLHDVMYATYFVGIVVSIGCILIAWIN